MKFPSPMSTDAPPSGSTFRRPSHVLYLDGLRGIAALYVVIHHAALQVYSSPGAFMGASWPVHLFLPGHAAVAAFIVLSGYCLTLPVVRTGWKLPEGTPVRWLSRRALRLLVPYWFSIGFTLILVALALHKKMGTHWDGCTSPGKRDILIHALLLQDVFNINNVNHAYWSIAVEWQIYFAFPLLVWLAFRRGPRTAALAGITAGAFLCAILFRTPYQSWHPQFLSLFALGMYSAHLAGRVERREGPATAIPWLPIASLLLAMCVYLCTRWGWDVLTTRAPAFDAVFGPAIASLLIGIAARPDHFSGRFLSWRPVVWAGTIGYSLYLIHAPMLQVVSQYLVIPLHLGNRTAFALTVLSGLPLSLLVAWIFYHAIELPAHNWARRIGRQHNRGTMPTAGKQPS